MIKFSNVVLYCKGWYKHRGGTDTMWMDLAHCIHADGWFVATKRDVVSWCLNRLDSWKDEFPQITFARLFDDIEQHKVRRSFYNKPELTTGDAIISVFCSYVANLDKSHFSDGVKPSNEVLPLHLEEAFFYEGVSKEYHFAEMMSERIDEINRVFKDYPEQNIDEFSSFEHVESVLSGKSWKNVVVLPGTDSLLTCKEVEVFGDVLLRPNFKSFDGKNYFEMGIYSRCKDFDIGKTYIVRYEEVLHGDDDFNYSECIIKSIKEK